MEKVIINKCRKYEKQQIKIPRKLTDRTIGSTKFMIEYYSKMDLTETLGMKISPAQNIECLEMQEKLRIDSLPEKERKTFWKSFL